MKFNKNIIFGIFFSLWAIFQTANAQTETNLEILTDLLVKPVISAVDSLYSGTGPFYLISEDNNDVSQWLEGKLRGELLNLNVSLKTEFTDSTSKTHYRLIIDKIDAKITYRGLDRDLLFRYGHYQRNINTLFTFYVINPHESISYSYSRTISHSDTLNRSETNKVENDFYEFSQGEKTGSRFSQKFIEPALVTVATIGVVYLFFSLRSGS